MVEIECPHCDEDIELDDDELGLFECSYCEEEFEWIPETAIDSDMFRQFEFWIGSLIPFGITFFGISMSLIILGDSWDFVGAVLIFVLLCPIFSIGIGIFGYIQKRMLLWFGAITSLAVWIFLFLIMLSLRS